jgi:hypothetical protein
MRIVLAIAAMMIATPVFAAKAHREASKEFPAKIKEAQGVVKSACGCAPSIAVDNGSFDKVPVDKVNDYKNNIGYEIQYIGEQSKAFCTDADSKKLYCGNTKKVTIKSGADGDVGASYSKKDKSFAVTTSNQSNSGGFKFKEILDSW